MKCFDVYSKCKVSCEIKDCRQWINYEEDLNCTIITVKKYGPLTLREISDRLGISFVRVKQIQDKTLTKLKKKSFT